jgi:lipoprotein-releasing system permease protein
MSHVFLLARKILFRRRGAVTLASGAVAATIFLNIFATTVFGGVGAGITGDIANLRFGDILVTYNRGVITTTDSQFILTLQSNPAIQGVTPRITATADVNSTTTAGVKSKYGVEFVGVDPTHELAASKLNGTLISGSLAALYQDEVILGANVARDLAVGPGQLVTLKVASGGTFHVRHLLVVGISQHAGFAGFDDSVLVNIQTARAMTGVQNGHSSGFIVKLKDPNTADSVKAWIESRFPKLTVQTVEEAAASFEASINQIVVFINLIGYAGMIASAMGVITILTMMVTGKTRDVGVLRAIGVQQWEVLAIFVIDGGIIGGLGATAGGLAGTIATLYLQATNAPIFGGFPLVITFTPLVLISPVAIGLAITLLASLYPAWRASRYKPAEAMRYF